MADEIVIKIFEKVEKIADNIDELKATTIKQQVILDEHVKRSNMLQDLYMDIKEKDIEPIKEDISSFKGAIKFITIAASLGSLITFFLKFLGII